MRSVRVVPSTASRIQMILSGEKTGELPNVLTRISAYMEEDLRTAIKTGITDGNMTEVEGLEPGREVIIDVASGKGKGKARSGGGAQRGP